MKFLEHAVVNTEKSNAPTCYALFSRPSQLRAEKLWAEKFIEQVKEEESLLNNFRID